MADLIRLTEKRPDKEIVNTVRSAIADATSKWAPMAYQGEYPTNGFGITNLRARDVCLTNAATGVQASCPSSIYFGLISITTASAWGDWINLTVDDRAYLVITGIFNLDPTPQISQLRFKANGEDLPSMSIEELYGWDLARGYLSKPFFVRPENNLTVRYVGRNTRASVERMGLLGYCIAKRSYLILE